MGDAHMTIRHAPVWLVQGPLAVQVVGDQFGMGMDDTHMKIRGAPVLDEPALDD